ncbi:unnamed protein product, partial [Symbiodinium natans]
MPVTPPRGLVLYEEMSQDTEVLYIQWQSFIMSFAAIGIGLSSVSVHRFWEQKQEQRKFQHRSQIEESYGSLWHVAGSICLSLYMASDSFLRMNAIATLLYSPYAVWFVVYAGTAYAGLPCLAVGASLIVSMFCEKDMDKVNVSCCANVGIVLVMYTGALLTAACAFLIPLDLALCWKFPPFSWLRLAEHLAMSIISFFIGAPLTWVPLLMWILSASTIVPSGVVLELYELPCAAAAKRCLGRLGRSARNAAGLCQVCPKGAARVQP